MRFSYCAWPTVIPLEVLFILSGATMLPKINLELMLQPEYFSAIRVVDDSLWKTRRELRQFYS